MFVVEDRFGQTSKFETCSGFGSRQDKMGAVQKRDFLHKNIWKWIFRFPDRSAQGRYTEELLKTDVTDLILARILNQRSRYVSHGFNAE